MLTEVEGVDPRAEEGTAHGAMIERSAGKDSTTGHWEIAGLVLERPFPLYPDGFPSGLIRTFERLIGRSILGNRAASGTAIIEELGEKHLRTESPIVYTSGDSVLQVAAHVDLVPLPTLYEWCRIARELLVGDHAVGRVIARPFAGAPGAFERVPGRRDLTLPPPGPTVLDALAEGGVVVSAVGKIADIFSGRGIADAADADSDDQAVDLSVAAMRRPGPRLVFTNLVDLDSKHGHRNDPGGYAACLQRFDARIPELLETLEGDVALFTGDHGCDPTTPSTDHSRERVPVLVAGADGGPVDLGTRASFADLGATVLELLLGRADGARAFGSSFASEIRDLA
jgi:phosphopentomutase